MPWQVCRIFFLVEFTCVAFTHHVLVCNYNAHNSSTSHSRLLLLYMLVAGFACLLCGFIHISLAKPCHMCSPSCFATSALLRTLESDGLILPLAEEFAEYMQG